MKRKGFTLVELIVVMAIIAILALFGLPKYLNHTKDANLTRIKVDVKELEKASLQYYIRYNQWPRIGEEPYTASQIEDFGEEIKDKTGQIVSLDSEGSYYDIDYSKIDSYIKLNDEGFKYILQNPVGDVFYIEGISEYGKNRTDRDYLEGNMNRVEITTDKSSYTLNENIIWSYTEVGESNGMGIVEVEWTSNKQDSYSEEGSYSVGLRVKNDKGIWTDWIYKTIYVMEEINFSGLSSRAYDGDLSTFYHGTGKVKWTGNIENKKLSITTQASRWYNTVTYNYNNNNLRLMFRDNDGEIVNIEGSSTNYITLSSGITTRTVTVSIPKGATELWFRGYSNSYSSYFSEGPTDKFTIYEITVISDDSL